MGLGKCVMEAFFKKEFINVSIKKMERLPRDTQKDTFSVLIFWLKITLNPTHGETLNIKGCRLAQRFRNNL